MSALGGSSLREGVGDLQVEKTGGDETDSVALNENKVSVGLQTKLARRSPSRPSFSGCDT